MGQCLCKDGVEPVNAESRSGSSLGEAENFTQEQVDELVLETLHVIRTKVEIEQDPPDSLIKLNAVAEKEEGWLQLVRSFVYVIPMSDPLGPAVMSLLLDDCPLPSRDTAMKCLDLLDTLPSKNSTKEHRNLIIVLGCITEKLAGPNSVALLTDTVLDYLVRNLKTDSPPCLTLFSLIALEKFTQTSENKSKIRKKFSVIPYKDHPLMKLEQYCDTDQDYVLRQVGFCAQWCLDNLLPVEGRKYSYQTTDTTNINIMLNSNDVSEYLKIGPNGLAARCDASSFESVRGTGQADAGCWYYEVLVVTSGVMQIGWATKHSKFLNHEGYGIGDDEFSQAYDGCRQMMWYNAVSENVSALPRWNPGDTVGCFLDIPNQNIKFSLNGVYLPLFTELFQNAKSGFFPAASFMSFQQCEFNFGWKPFKYPPAVEFSAFNEVSSLTPDERLILPRPLKLAILQRVSLKEDACTLCFDNKAVITFLPCNHKGFCETCAVQLELCPMCRGKIQSLLDQSADSPAPTLNQSADYPAPTLNQSADSPAPTPNFPVHDSSDANSTDQASILGSPFPNPSSLAPNPSSSAQNSSLPAANPSSSAPNSSLPAPNPCSSAVNSSLPAANPSSSAQNSSLSAPNPRSSASHSASSLPSPEPVISTVFTYNEEPPLPSNPGLPSHNMSAIYPPSHNLSANGDPYPAKAASTVEVAALEKDYLEQQTNTEQSNRLSIQSGSETCASVSANDDARTPSEGVKSPGSEVTKPKKLSKVPDKGIIEENLRESC